MAHLNKPDFFVLETVLWKYVMDVDSENDIKINIFKKYYDLIVLIACFNYVKRTILY